MPESFIPAVKAAVIGRVWSHEGREPAVFASV
jgi:hypothetical protein